MSEGQDPPKDGKESQDVDTTASAQGSRATLEQSKETANAKSLVKTNPIPDRVESTAATLNDGDEDSEAETLIQSPEKKRTIIDNAPVLQPSQGNKSTVVANAPKHDVQSRKRKRSVNETNTNLSSPPQSHRSSPLSSPIANANSGESDSEHSNNKKSRKHDRTRTKRNETREQSAESENNPGISSARRRRPSDAMTGHVNKKERHALDNGERRETRSATYPRHSDDERSPSPQQSSKREHRRGASTQLTTHELERKRRGRPPLISTKRHRSVERTRSPDSERSNSPAPQRLSLHKFTSQDHDTMSPLKAGPKKRRDKNGRTPVARHANSGNLDLVKTELAEHREDLNLADNAGNTPLQIAALEGHIDIVEYLLSQGCEVDTRNIDKDTPLIDAVENGHVEVVKLLLDHGANPRVGNAKGDEPYELVPDDDENYVEIRRLLADAKNRQARVRGHDQSDGNQRDGNSSRAASAASPRDSPPVGPRSPPAFSSRRRTGRSESTRNDLLWQAHNQPTLAKLAAKGDVQGVANILNILQKAETESLIAAAKAGHEEVLQHLLAMGDPDPDPTPVKSLPNGYNTPLLAAIGRGHIDVVKLLISQSGFDPTRKLYGRYYYELARERKGADWQQEHEVLKSAFDRYTNTKGRKQTTPRKTRDHEKAKHRTTRRSLSPVSLKRNSSSPSMTHKTLPNKSSDSSPKEKRKLSGNRLENTDSSTAIASDLEQTVNTQTKGHRPRRSQSDLPVPRSIDSDGPYRRRRLVTGKEHRRNKSSANGSESDDEAVNMIEVKREDRSAPKLKRPRGSQSPEPPSSTDLEKARAVPKKRRTVESSPEDMRVQPVKTTSPASRRKSSSGADKHGSQVPDGLTDIALSTSKQLSDDPTQVNVKIEEVVDGEGSPNTEVADVEVLPDADAPNDQMSTDVEPMVVDAPQIPNFSETNTEEPMAETVDTNGDLNPQTEASNNDTLDETSNRLAAEQAEKAAAEEKARLMEEEATKQREEEILQAQKKAEEMEAKRKAEEEAARKKEEERQEQKRREIEHRRRQQDIEIERRRLAKLPAALSKTAILLNENDPLARDEHWLREKFLPLFTVTTRQLDPHCSEAAAKEQWIPNYQVAGLLATKDLNLRAYTSIEKRPANLHERGRLWGVSRIQLSFDYLMNWGMGISNDESNQRERENREKFMTMDDIFWVKLLDFHDQVPRYPHLAGVKLQTQPISLKTWNDVLGEATASKSPKSSAKLSNGIHMASSTISGSIS